jgi:probable HAF family extracellular repeat protein
VVSRSFCFLIVLVCSIALARGASAATMYHVTDLGDIPGGMDGSTGVGINAYGQVTGGSGYQNGTQGFVWTPTQPNGIEGSMTPLGTVINRGFSIGNAINIVGQIAGSASSTAGGSTSQLWSPTTPNSSSGSWTDLGTVPGAQNAGQGNGINDYGQVAGTVFFSTGNPTVRHAVVWTPSAPSGTAGQMTDLGDLPGGADDAIAYAVNMLGQVVGIGHTAANTVTGRAFMWKPDSPHSTTGTMVELNGLGAANQTSEAHGINASGQVAAYANGHATRWTPTTPNGTTGTAVDLGDLPGSDNNSVGLGINDAGDIVGYGHGTPFFRHAVVWPASGGLIDLNTVLDASGAGWGLTEARAINNLGQIAGVGEFTSPDFPQGVTHAFLLTPTTLLPEPGGILLLSAGLLGPRRSRRLLPR